MTSATLRRRMTAMDASFLYFEKASQPLHIGSTSTLDGHLSRESLIAHMRSRMHRLPRYRERAAFDAFNLGHPVWEEDPEFDVDRHIDEVTLPAGASAEDLNRVIASIFTPVLPRDRPLWRMVLLQGLPGGRSAVTTLIHHCMVDGVSGMELLTVMTDLEREAVPEEPAPFEPAAVPTNAERVQDAWSAAIDSGFAATAEAVKWAFNPQQQLSDMRTVSSALSSAAPVLWQPAPPTPFNRPVSGERSYASLPMSFAEIREVRSALGGTLNDVVLTTLAGALGLYLRGLGERTEGVDLRAMVPVNVRQAADKSALGNQVSLLIAQLPIGITDPVARHHTLMARMDGLKKANQAGGFALLSRLAENVPPVMQAFAGNFVPNGQQLFNLVCTNVPGPQIPLYLAGRRLEDLRPLVPISMGLGLNVALTSYDGALYWGICADPNLVPTVQQVANCLWQSFEELRTAARAAVPA